MEPLKLPMHLMQSYAGPENRWAFLAADFSRRPSQQYRKGERLDEVAKVPLYQENRDRIALRPEYTERLAGGAAADAFGSAGSVPNSERSR